MPAELPETFSEDFVKALEARAGIGTEETPDEAASSAAGAGEVEVDEPVETETVSDEPKVDDDEPEVAASETEGQPEEKKTFWDQTPEEKRAQVFNDTKQHSIRQKEELEAIRAENARLKAASESKSPVAAQPVDLDGWIREAIVADDESKLSEAQRKIRSAAVELDTFTKQTLQPAEAKAKASTESFTKLQGEVDEQRIYLKRLEARAEKDPNGFYDDQIAEAKKELSSLESAAARAEVSALSADRELEKVTNRRDLHIGRTRERAASFHRDEVKERTTQAEREAEQTRLAKAQDEIDQEWNSDLSAVQKESGLSGELWDRMQDVAFKYVEKKAATETIAKGAFKALILEAINPILSAMGKSTASTLASKRDALASEPGAGRVATKVREAAPHKTIRDLEKDAIREMQSAFKTGARF